MSDVPPPSRPGVRVRYEIFASEIIKGTPARKAAIAAGYSPRSAHGQATALLKQPYIRHLIDRAVQKAGLEAQVTIERVLREAARLAFFDPARMFKDGQLLAVEDMDEDTRMAIASAEVEERAPERDGETVITVRVKKVRMTDKGQAVERLMRHLRMFPNTMTVNGPTGGAIPVEVAHRTELTDEQLEEIILEGMRARGKLPAD